jgi:hypothetical protein
MFKRLTTMKVIVHILMSLAVCTEVPAIYDFFFVYGHGYSQFDCLTEVLLVRSTLKPPTVWQLGKYRLRRGRRLLLSSRRAQEHIRTVCFCLEAEKGCSEKVKRSSNTENIFTTLKIFSTQRKRYEKTHILHAGCFFIVENYRHVCQALRLIPNKALNTVAIESRYNFFRFG